MTDLAVVSQIDWARLAAFIDGEGCIGTKQHCRTRGITLRAHIATTDPRLTQWLLRIFGGSVCECRASSTRNTRWRMRLDWTVYGKDAAAILAGCLPYLLLKRQQAEIGLAFQSTIRSGAGRRGVALDAVTIAARHTLRANLQLLNKKGPRDLAVASGE